MLTRRDKDAERIARIALLIEENSNRTETTANVISKVLDHVEKAARLARANVDAAKLRRRASKP